MGRGSVAVLEGMRQCAALLGRLPYGTGRPQPLPFFFFPTRSVTPGELDRRPLGLEALGEGIRRQGNWEHDPGPSSASYWL